MSNRFHERVGATGSGGGGNGGGGLDELLISNSAFVDPEVGDDGTAMIDHLELPFATVQAAVDAVYAAGPGNYQIVVWPGDYDEDVVFPTTAGTWRISMWGSGIDSTRIKSLQLRPAATVAAGDTLWFNARELSLSGEVGVPTVSPLRISEPGGAYDSSLIANFESVRVVADGGLATAAIFVSIPTEPSNPNTFLWTFRDVEAVGDRELVYDADRGEARFYVSDLSTEVARVFRLTEVAFGRFHYCYLRNTGAVEGFLSTSVTDSPLQLLDCILELPGNADVGTMSTVVQPLWLLGDVVVINGGGGTLNSTGGDVIYDDFADDSGAVPVLVGFGTELLIETANGTYFDPSSTDLISDNVQRLGEELVRGRWELAASIAVAGPTALSPTSFVNRVDTATIGAPSIVTLPPAVVVGDGKVIAVKDETGAAGGAAPITVAPSGGDTIDGAPSAIISAAFGALTFVADGVGGNFLII